MFETNFELGRLLMKDLFTFISICIVLTFIFNPVFFGINEFSNCDGVQLILSEQSRVEYPKQPKIIVIGEESMEKSAINIVFITSPLYPLTLLIFLVLIL